MKNKVLVLISFIFIVALTACSAMYKDFQNLGTGVDIPVEVFFEATDSLDTPDTPNYAAYEKLDEYVTNQPLKRFKAKNYPGFELAKREDDTRLDDEGQEYTVIQCYYRRLVYTITLDPAGGYWTDVDEDDPERSNPRTISGKYETKVTLDPTWIVKKDNHALTLGDEWNPSLPETFSENITLQAKWYLRVLEKYTVYFYPNGADEGNIFDIDFTETVPQVLPKCNYKKLGYNFGGWAKTESGAKVYDDEQEITLEKTDVNSDGELELYAVWIEKGAYTITYMNADDVDSNESPNSFKETDNVQLKTATKTGYTFGGWFETPELDAGGERIRYWNKGDKTSNVVLYAKWTPNKHTVNFDSNTGTGSMAGKEFTFDTPDALPLNTFSKVGYRFAGWSTTAGGNNKYSDGGTYTLKEDSDVTLYAVWEELDALSITYAGVENGTHSNPGTFKIAENVELVAATRTGYTFGGWYETSTLTGIPTTGWKAGEKTSDVTLYAKWNANSYTVEFKANGGSGDNMPSQEFLFGIPKDLPECTYTKVGYTFAGWAETAQANEDTVIKGQYTLQTAGTVQLYAIWRDNGSHTITYNNVDSEYEGITTFKETDKVELNTPVKTGYTFGGWFTTSALTGTSLTGWNPGEKTESVTLYAKWTPNKYKVIFSPNGGTGTMDQQEFTFDTSANLKANAFTRIGYTFGGWATASDGVMVYADKASYSTGAADVILYAVWNEKPGHKITYNNVNGAENTNPAEFKEKDTVTLNNISLDGYTFGGWFTTSALTGTAVTGWAAGAKTSDVVLYAKWTANTYVVSFNNNGGSGSMTSQNYTYGTPKALPANTFTRTDYEFIGWSTSEEGSVEYADKASFAVPAEDTILYAVWKLKDALTITYNNVEGATNSNPSSFVQSSNITLHAPVKTGYTFGGWYKEADCSGSAVTTISGSVEKANVVLYAKWTANKHNVILDSNDESGLTVSQEFSFDESKALTANTFTRTGYTFDGWSTAPNGVKLYADGASYTLKVDSDVVLYAVWVEKPGHAITYMNTKDVTSSNPHTFKEKDAVTIYPISKAGFTFNGWYENEAGTGTAVTGWAAGAKTSDVVLYAKWTPNNYVVTFNANDGSTTPATKTQTYTYTVAAPLNANTFTRTGYTFAGWAKAKDATSKLYDDKQTVSLSSPADVTLYAVWEVIPAHKITYNNVSGITNNNPGTFFEKDSVTITALEREGYTFGGWFDNAGLTGTSVTGWAAGAKTGDVVLYAKWTPKTYTVSFDSNGGSGTMTAQTVTYTVEETVKANTFTRTGYTFAGWSLTSNGTKVCDDNGTYTLASPANVTFYALWTEKPAHNITFYNTMDVSNPNSNTFKEKDAVTLTALSKDGFEFDGWYLGSDGSGAKVTGWAAGDKTGNVELYAKWTPKTYAVSFNANGGSGTMADQIYTYTVAAPLSKNKFTRLGYTFVGWSKSATGSKLYDDEQSATLQTPASVTLYALWSENAPHSIIYTGVTGATNSNPGTFKETESITLTAPTKVGYTFEGWYLGTDASGSKVTGWTAGTYLDDVNLFANWTPISYKVSFNANGGSGSMSDQSIPYQTTAALTQNGFTRTGYKFKGWSTTAAGAVEYADKGNYKISTPANVTLYAVWEVGTYTITFNSNGGTGSMGTQTLTYGTPAALKANLYTRAGFTFAGWATSSTAKTAEYADKAEYTIGDADVTLYAVWNSGTTGITITNTYTGDVDVDEEITGHSVKLTANPPYSSTWTYTWYVDGVEQSGTSASITIELTSGTHTVIVEAQNSSGDYRINTFRVSIQ